MTYLETTMPPEELQRRSADERAKGLLSRTADTKRCNWHMLKTATNATGVLAKTLIEADVFFGVARLLDDPAHREMLRKLGRDDQAAAVKQTLLVEVPGPVDDDVDATLTKGLGLRRHTYAKNTSDVWVYRGEGVLPVIEDCVGPLGGTVTSTRHKDVKPTVDPEASTSPSDLAIATVRSEAATSMSSDDGDARGEVKHVGQAATFETAAASASCIVVEAEAATTAGGTGVEPGDARNVAGEPKATTQDANEATQDANETTRPSPSPSPQTVTPNSDGKPGVLAQADASRFRQDTGARRFARLPARRDVLGEATAAAVAEPPVPLVIPDFLKNRGKEGME